MRHSVDALTSRKFRVVSLEHLDAQVDQIQFVLVSIGVQEITYFLADEVNLFEMLVR